MAQQRTLPVALQLYSVRDTIADRGLEPVLTEVAAFGYDGVEFAGYWDHEAGDIRKMLDQLGLICVGTHVGLDQLEGDKLRQVVSFNQVLGNHYLIVPAADHSIFESADAIAGFAQRLNAVCDNLGDSGMRVGFHNHMIEFKPLPDGRIPWQVLFEQCRPEVVMQLDTGNCLHGGGDPAEQLRAFGPRALTVHLKEHSDANPDALIGEGDVDWQTILDLCRGDVPTEYLIVEQESYPVAPLECARRCREGLKQFGV